jgi:hypothetical protein
MAIMAVGGADEHVFRSVDVAVSSVVFFGVGAVLPGIAARPSDPPPGWALRVTWGLAGWAALGAQYVVFGWWDTSQRESFYDLFLLTSIALQLIASRPVATHFDRRIVWAIVGALSASTWFGKPTCVVFTLLQVGVTVVDRQDPTRLQKRLGALGLGAAVATAAMLTFIAAYGDLAGFFRIVLLESPRLYRPIWAKSIADCYTAWGNAPKLNYGLATAAGVLALAATRRLPARFYVVATLLVGGLVVFFAQGKAFPYHMHPVTAGTRLVWLAALAAATERWASAARAWRRAIPVACAAAIGWQCLEDARLSSYAKSEWNVAGATAAGRRTEEYVRQFPWEDFFAWDIRQAAAFLDATTEETDRVQLYGMDPYVLFLARRLSASPYVYSFELNVDASLAGGSGGHPDAADRAWMESIARGHAEEMQAALERQPPAAFVIIDRIPFTYPQDSEVDLAQHCPATWEWMRARYRRATRFGGIRVWLRNDAFERAVASGALER